MFGGIRTSISDAVQNIKDHLPWSPAKRGPLSGRGSPIIGGANITRQLAEGLRQTRPVEDAMGELAELTTRMPAARVPMSAEVARYASAEAGRGDSSRGVSITVHNQYPREEPTSTTVNRSLQYAGALGIWG